MTSISHFARVNEIAPLGAPQLRAIRRIRGHKLSFVPVNPDDAEFILSLRLDPDKGKHLSTTIEDVDAQRLWLADACGDPAQLYFVIVSRNVPVGTVRIYDVVGDSFCWGSWILSRQAPTSSAVESTVMLYAFALASGFHRAHFDVRKANEKVWQYHERWGARRVGETELDYFYTLSEQCIRVGLERYQSRLPDGIMIEWAA